MNGLALQNKLRLKSLNYRSKLDFIIVLFSILLSKSLYYETYGDNKLLVPFFGCLILIALSKKIAINKYVILYSFFISILVIVNVNSQLDSILVLLTRLGVAALIISYMDFEKYASIFIEIILFVSIISLLYIIVIVFNTSSFIPDFVGIAGLHLRNFIFFGVRENFVIHDVIRNSGLWWEPGAFQLFVNLAFIFSLALGTMNKKKYILFMVTILSTVSTAGVLVFFMLSLIYFGRKTSRNKIAFLATLVLISISVFSFMLFFPQYLHKFYSLSFLGRYCDLIISYELFIRNIFLGYGYGSQLEVAIPFGKEFLGDITYNKYPITGSDGITMLIAQSGVFMILLLKPFFFPAYIKNFNMNEKLIVMFALLVLFNTQNFVFILIFNILVFYGIVGIKNISNNSLRYVINQNVAQNIMAKGKSI